MICRIKRKTETTIRIQECSFMKICIGSTSRNAAMTPLVMASWRQSSRYTFLIDKNHPVRNFSKTGILWLLLYQSDILDKPLSVFRRFNGDQYDHHFFLVVRVFDYDSVVAIRHRQLFALSVVLKIIQG